MELIPARIFCDRWLPAWTGNRPDALLACYAPDAVYRDPSQAQGLKGHEQLRPYLSKLLAANPGWTWSAEEIIPTEAGFTLKWKASIPIGDKAIVEYGLDIVDMKDGLIARNEVYFDQTQLLRALRVAKETARH